MMSQSTELYFFMRATFIFMMCCVSSIVAVAWSCSCTLLFSTLKLVVTLNSSILQGSLNCQFPSPVIFYSYTVHRNQSTHPVLYSYTVHRSQLATTILYIRLVSIRKVIPSPIIRKDLPLIISPRPHTLREPTYWVRLFFNRDQSPVK
jgi:hypothetical protein